MNQEALDTLMYWITERESMRERKEFGKPRPWTNDPIMAQYRWCNVHREDDRVTRWIANNWRDNHSSHPHLAIAMVVARLVNWPESLGYLGYPVDGWNDDYRNHFIKMMGSRSDQGYKVWTGAYMVTGGYSKGGEGKEVIIARVIDSAAPQAALITPGMSMGAAGDLFADVKGVGTFLTGQILADLKYTPLLQNAVDWQTWCAPGPGSIIGLNFLNDRPRRTNMNWVQFRTEVNEVRKIIEDKLGIILHAQDTQNCLCEFHKYWRAKVLGETLKTRYVPGRGS